MVLTIGEPVLDIVPVALVITRDDGQIMEVNAYAEKLFGYTREELHNTQISALLAAHSRDELDILLAACRNETDGPSAGVAGELRVLCKNAGQVTVAINLLAVETEEGRLFSHVFRDIAEQKRIEQDFKDTRDELQTILDNVPAYVFYKDTRNTILRANKAAADSLGVSPKDMAGCSTSIFYPEFADQYYKDDLEVIRSGVPKLGIVEPLTVSEHKIRWIETSKIPIRNADDKVSGILVLASDITERKQAEQALRAAKNVAEQASSAKTRFLAAASHDLRQPLQTISLLTSALSIAVDDQQTRQYVDALKEAIEGMKDLLTALLDVSKLEGGAVEPELCNFQVEGLLNRMRVQFQPHTEEKGLSLRVVPCTATIRSDPTLLEQIVRNLLDNAVRHTCAGSVLLGCRRHGSVLSIEVWDTGTGIPQDQLRKIFDDFYQLDNPARDRSKGLGLGLAITRRVADILGHTIDVRSWAGKGSKFSVAVPLKTVAAHSHADRLAKPVIPRTDAVPVLIIDDDSAVLDSSRLLFELSGYQVISAISGSDASNQLSNCLVQPQLIIADYRLPDGDTGIQVIQRIRSALGHNIPAIVVTGDTSSITSGELHLGDCEILSKPVDGDELIRLVGELIGRAGSATLRGEGP